MTYDVAIIGGGVNGAGIARDCAMRGLTTVLVEKKDLGSGASGASSGMIHGGLRYLATDIATSRRSCLDSGYIQRICPHLLFRIPFIMPVAAGKRILLELVETYLEAYDWFAPLKRGKPHVRLTPDEVRRIEPGITRTIQGGIMFDEWGIDGHRLCVLNALSARGHGAEIRTHTEAVEFIRDGAPGGIAGVRVKDGLTGRTGEIRARVVVNAGGPWLPGIARKAGCEVKLRPGKGVHLVLDRRITNVGVLTDAIDGRSIFVIPHENASLIGTTDDDYYGDLDDLSATQDEVEYLLEGTSRVFPALREARVMTTTVGVRSTLFESGKYEDDLTREHRTYDHAADGAPGLITIAGGKLASYRLQAEEVTDHICRRLGREGACRTHLEPLPGSEEGVDASTLAREFRVHPYAAARLVYRHGCRARSILEMTREHPGWLSPLCPCEPVIEAEVRWCIREEWARTLEDVRNRTRLGFGPCQGMACAGKASMVLAEELGMPPEAARRDLEAFLALGRRERGPILRGEQMAAEEMLHWTYTR